MTERILLTIMRALPLIYLLIYEPALVTEICPHCAPGSHNQDLITTSRQLWLQLYTSPMEDGEFGPSQWHRWCLCWENKDVDIQPSGEGVSNQSQQLSPNSSWKGNVPISFSKWQQPWQPLWFLVSGIYWGFPFCALTDGFNRPCQHNLGGGHL